MNEVEELKKQNQQLQTQLVEKEQDIKEIAIFVFATLRSLGVKKFDDLDNVGRTAMAEVPTIMMEATVMKHKLRKRFEHLSDAQPLLEKYKHYIPQA